jgi:hypothetical protein
MGAKGGGSLALGCPEIVTSGVGHTTQNMILGLLYTSVAGKVPLTA